MRNLPTCARAGSTLVSGLLAIALLLCLASDVTAAIYWSNGFPIGRANLSGTGPEPEFIRYMPFGSPSAPSVSTCGGVAVDSSYIYWADPAGGAIGRANLDGSGPNPTFITGAENPCGVAVDNQHLYWTNYRGNSIGRANLDGSELTQTFIGAVSEPCGLAVGPKFIYWSSATAHYIGRALVQAGDKGPHLVDGDGSFDFCGLAVNDSHLFWGGFGDRIGRVNLDGSDPHPAFISGLERPCGLALDGNHIYWSENREAGRIGAANLDSTAPNGSIVTELTRPCGVAVDSVFVPPSLPRQLSRFTFGEIRYNKRRGVVFLPVDFPGGGYLHVKVTAGFSWALRPDRLIGGVLPGAGQRWLKIWPGQKGRNGRRIRQQLKAHGRTSVGAEIEYTETGHQPTTKGKRLRLLMAR